MSLISKHMALYYVNHCYCMVALSYYAVGLQQDNAANVNPVLCRHFVSP